MILDKLKNSERYLSLNSNFAAAFDFVKQASALKEGEYSIDGENVFAIVAKQKGVGKENARLETHKKYIDIQCVFAGMDYMGWKSASECELDKNGFDDEKDCGFYINKPTVWLPVHEASFAIFFPEDAHAPMGTEDFVHKIILKVAV